MTKSSGDKKTHSNIAKKAAKVLADPKASKLDKSLAGSALSQSPGHKGGKKKK